MNLRNKFTSVNPAVATYTEPPSLLGRVTEFGLHVVEEVPPSTDV